MKIRVKYKNQDDSLPLVQHGDWIDLRCAKTMKIDADTYCAIPLGLAIQLPEGYEAIVAPRSSTFKNYGLLPANGIGIIDNSYCGDGDEWHFLVYATNDSVVQKGDRICQFRILKNQPKLEFEVVDTLGNENRGGIGSTGTI